MMGVFIDDESRAYCEHKAKEHAHWLKWLEETHDERTKLILSAIEAGTPAVVKERS